MDFLFPTTGGVWLLERKGSRTVQPTMAAPVAKLKLAIGPASTARMSVVYRAGRSTPNTRALSPEVEALDENAFIREIN